MRVPLLRKCPAFLFPSSMFSESFGVHPAAVLAPAGATVTIDVVAFQPSFVGPTGPNACLAATVPFTSEGESGPMMPRALASGAIALRCFERTKRSDAGGTSETTDTPPAPPPVPGVQLTATCVVL